MMVKTKQSGFTFVETLVAITILLVALVAPLTIVTKTSQSNGLANEQIIAYFLAQEGVELAQQVRDQISLQYLFALNDGSTPNPTFSPWITQIINGVNYSVCVNNDCGLDRFNSSANAEVQAMSPVSCSAAGNPCQLYFQSNGPRLYYTHNAAGATPTAFTRRIRFADVVPGEEAQIISRVTWRSGLFFQEQQVEVRTTIFNIYEETI